MRELIGFYLITMAISSFVILVLGDAEMKEKLCFLAFTAVILAMIITGTYLLAGE